MLATRMKFLGLACGLLAVGAVATAQQSGRPRRARSTVPPPDAVARDAEPRRAAYPVSPPREAADPEVEKEIKKLELSLLEEEVKLLHDDVTATLKEILQYRTSTTTADPRASKDAEEAYIKARETYLRRARDLAVAKRKLEPAAAPKKDGADPKNPGGVVRIGAVDLDAVVARGRGLQGQGANALDEIQKAIGQVARSKGLDVVVRSFPGASAAKGLPVLYADPRVDITEDVLRELNGHDPAAGKAAP